MTIRVAMWSGPRNISTAMMRSWENRADTSVVDEPFYAYYLTQTQAAHPMFEQIIASQSSNYAELAYQMRYGDCSSEIQYQKHMTHHILAGVPFEWMQGIRHCFLIRDPAYVVASYTKRRGTCTADDIGIKRQYEIFEYIQTHICDDLAVIDAADVLRDPEQVLKKLCQRLHLPFSDKMLKWPAGPRESDGVWASHWYKSVESSTGFSAEISDFPTLTKEQQAVVDSVTPYYLKMQERVIR